MSTGCDILGAEDLHTHGAWMAGWMLMQGAPTQTDAIDWDAPSQCPPQSAMLEEVQRLLGGAQPDLERVHARAHIERRDSDYALTLVVETSDGSTERTLASPSCEALVDSAALYLAMAVDPVATVSAPSPPPKPEPEPEPAAPTRAFDLRATGGASFAVYPSPGGIASLVGSWALGNVRLELGGTFGGWTPLSLGEGAPRASVRSVGGELRVCPSVRRGAVELFACAGTHIAMHRARGLSVDESRVVHRLGVDALAATGLAWWVSERVALWLEPDMVVGVYRPRFVVDGARGSVTQNPVGARVGFGVQVRLWEAGRG